MTQNDTVLVDGLPVAGSPSLLVTTAGVIFLTPIISTILWCLINYFTSPLRKYPGPFLGGWTNFYRMWYAYKGNMHTITKELHDKYGPVVRMAPNYIDVDYSSLIKTCFDVQGVWQKTPWHGVSGAIVDGKLYYNIFSEVRSAEHAIIKKPIAKYFSPNGVAPLEPHVDAVLGALCEQLAERFAGDKTFGESFNFGEWVIFYAWDVVAKTTWSKTIGYMEKGHDFDGSISIAEKAMDYLAVVGMLPVCDKFLDKNPVYHLGPPAFADVTNMGLSHLMARMKGEDKHDPTKRDFLDGYLEAQQKNPEVVDVYRILSYMLVNLAAGADTTALSLRSIFWLSLKHPEIYSKMEAEVTNAKFTQIPVPYSEARKLLYMDAVIRECLRFLPGNCFAQERLVPAGGLKLPDGSFVPQGTEIGFNAYVLHRNKEDWGEDAEEFNPDRWLQGETESDEAFKSRIQHLNNVDMSFGQGHRKCIGQNIGRLEVYKTTATLLSLFEWQLADPAKDWTIHNSIFPRQSGVRLKIKKRVGTGEILEGMNLDY